MNIENESYGGVIQAFRTPNKHDGLRFDHPKNAAADADGGRFGHIGTRGRRPGTTVCAEIC